MVVISRFSRLQAAKECVAGFILEDQEWPKKCGHMANRGARAGSDTPTAANP